MYVNRGVVWKTAATRRFGIDIIQNEEGGLTNDRKASMLKHEVVVGSYSNNDEDEQRRKPIFRLEMKAIPPIDKY